MSVYFLINAAHEALTRPHGLPSPFAPATALAVPPLTLPCSQERAPAVRGDGSVPKWPQLDLGARQQGLYGQGERLDGAVAILRTLSLPGATGPVGQSEWNPARGCSASHGLCRQCVLSGWVSMRWYPNMAGFKGLSSMEVGWCVRATSGG